MAADACKRADQATGNVPDELLNRGHEAEAAWRAGRHPAAVQIWREMAAAYQQRGDEDGARAPRLRLADAQAASGRPDDIQAARAAVRAALATADEGVPLGGDFGLAARLGAWRVLQRAGDPDAKRQRLLAATELEQVLSGFDDADVRERVARVVPWHRDLVDALRHGTWLAAATA